MAETPSDQASAAKSFLVAQRTGMLSSISVSQQGYPFGSITPYDIDDSGNVYIYISLIAEHYRNLTKDKRGSLIAIDPYGVHDPQAHARATLLADFAPVLDSERSSVQARYEARFPASINYEIAHNFVFMRGTPVKLRWIGGFGDIRWIDAERFKSAVPDPVAYHAHEVLAHMNLDHADALQELAHAHCADLLPATRYEMTEITSSHFSIVAISSTGSRKVEVSFPVALKSAQDSRVALIELLRKARGQAT
ncbi:MAG: DUF2470 domain-containing protein [Oligoflexia bacterium]|nr:DUF2470 domain-containing protein [Oligoflexia bacterium]